MKRRVPLLVLTAVVLCVAGISLWMASAKRQYTLNRQLIDALKDGDTEAALVLVNAEADPNTRYHATPAPSFKLLFVQWLHHSPPPVNDSPTALMIACGGGWNWATGLPDPLYPVEEDLPLLRAMLAHGANVHARAELHFTALHWAVQRDRGHTAELLLQHGADVNEQDERGMTPLMWAMGKDTKKMACLLLSYGANPNVRSAMGNTALHNAVGSPAAIGIIPELLAHGADPNIKNNYGDTPLPVAQQLHLSNVVRLLKRGAK